MGGELIDGKALAAAREVELGARCSMLRASGVTPRLVVILVGDAGASELYVRFKRRAAARIGIEAELRRLPAGSSAAEVSALITELNEDAQVHGILLQLPLPAPLSIEETWQLMGEISPAKDVDGLHPENQGLLGTNQGFTACTPLGSMRLLEHVETPLTGARALVIGRSRIVGRPMATLLTAANATVTVAHSRSRALDELVREADVLIAAAGVQELVKGAWVKPGATVIDVGIHRRPTGELCGDVEHQAARQRARAITPVPGGVGPMTVSSLMENVCKAAERQLS